MREKQIFPYRPDGIFRWIPAGFSAVLLCCFLAGSGCGGNDVNVTPQTMRRVHELLDLYEQTRRSFFESDVPGRAGQPDPAWIEEALSLLDSAAGRQADPQEREGLQIRAWMLKEDWDLAAGALEEQVKQRTASAEVWRKLALCRLKMGPAGWPRAEEAARKSLELDPGSAEGWWLAGKAAQAQDKRDEARSCFAKALETDSGYLPARLEQAVEAVSEGDFAAASAVLREAGKKARPYDVMLRMEFRQALAEAEKAGKAIPATSDQYAPAARVYYQAARFEDAVKWARQALEIHPDDFECLGLLTLTLTQLGRMEEGVEACQRFLDVHPEHEGANALLNQLRQAGKGGEKSSVPGATASPGKPAP